MGKGSNLVILLFLFLFISSASAFPQIILMWNGTNETIPENFTCVSCNSSQNFYQKYPRFTDTLDPTPSDGGYWTHNHTITIQTATSASYITATIDYPNGFNTAGINHLHTTVTASAFTKGSNVPLTKSVIFIKSNTTINYLPVGVIALFNSTTPPENFTLFNEYDGYYLMGNNTNNQTCGGGGHNHTQVNFTTGNPSQLGNGLLGIKSGVASVTHKHNGVSSFNDSVITNPAYVSYPLIIAVNYTALPNGLIAMFESDITDGNYTLLTGINDMFLFINQSGVNTTGGNATHTHINYSGVSTSGSSFISIFYGITNFPISSHAHVFNLSTVAKANTPPYHYVILGIYNKSSIPIPTNVTGLNRTVVFDWPNWYIKEQREKQRMTSIYIFIGYTIFLSVGFLMIWRQ